MGGESDTIQAQRRAIETNVLREGVIAMLTTMFEPFGCVVISLEVSTVPIR